MTIKGALPVRDRPQLVIIWESLTDRHLDDAKLKLMISRPAFAELDRYLDVRGARWLRARAAEYLSRSRSGYVLRLDDWVRECRDEDKDDLLADLARANTSTGRRRRDPAPAQGGTLTKHYSRTVKGMKPIMQYGEET